MICAILVWHTVPPLTGTRLYSTVHSLHVVVTNRLDPHLAYVCSYVRSCVHSFNSGVRMHDYYHLHVLPLDAGLATAYVIVFLLLLYTTAVEQYLHQVK